MATTGDSSGLEMSTVRALVVDDDDATRTLLTRILSRIGVVDVRPAADGRELMAEVDAFDPHLILMDLHMPGVDGFESLAALGAGDLERPTRVVLLLTGD